MRDLKGPSLLVLLSLLPAATSALIPNAHALTRGVVCVADPTSTSCPSGPINLSGSIGTQLAIAVNIQDSISINGFDIFVKSDPTVLHAMSVDLSNSVLGTSVITITDCIDFGPGCTTAQNGIGIVEVAVVALGSITTAPTTGHLFSVNYNITKTVPSIKVGFQTGCTGTSASPNFCVTVVDGGTVVPETIQESTGFWGDFAMSISPTMLTLLRQQYGLALVTISTVDGFFGSISLSISLSPTKRAAPTVQFVGLAEIFLPPGTSTQVFVSVTTAATTHQGDYTVTITGTAGTLIHTIPLAVEILR